MRILLEKIGLPEAGDKRACKILRILIPTLTYKRKVVMYIK